MKWKKKNCPICGGDGMAWLTHNNASGYKYKKCDHTYGDNNIEKELSLLTKQIYELGVKKKNLEEVIAKCL